MKTAYTALQVTENAMQEVIDAAWKALLKKYHPDANPGVDPRIAQQLNRAHDILTDPEQRAAYDAQLYRARMAKEYGGETVSRRVSTASGYQGMYGGVQFIVVDF